MKELLKRLKARSVQISKKNGIYNVVAHFNKNHTETALVDFKNKEVDTSRDNKNLIDFFAKKEFLVVVEYIKGN